MSVPRQESKCSCFTVFLVYICVFRGIQFSSFYDFWIIQSNLYIKAIQGNLKMWPFWEAALYMQVKLYALFINGEMRLPFIDSDLLYWGALWGRFDYIFQIIPTLWYFRFSLYSIIWDVTRAIGDTLTK